MGRFGADGGTEESLQTKYWLLLECHMACCMLWLLELLASLKMSSENLGFGIFCKDFWGCVC